MTTGCPAWPWSWRCASVVALGVGLVGTFALAVRVLVWFLARVFSVCCVLVQG